MIDDVRIYDVVLTAEEIAAMAHYITPERNSMIRVIRAQQQKRVVCLLCTCTYEKLKDKEQNLYCNENCLCGLCVITCQLMSLTN